MAIYGPPTPLARPLFWDCLNSIGANFDGPWMVAGDFNVTLTDEDKNGGRSVASSSKNSFRHMVDSNALIDMGFDGHSFTWNNKMKGKANIQERLDRGFANASWRIKFPLATVSHLLALHSDHRPLFFQIKGTSTQLPRSFQFETMWTIHPETGYIIAEAWERSSSFISRIKNTKIALKIWNNKTFGHIPSRIKLLTDMISNLQTQPPNCQNPQLEQTI